MNTRWTENVNLEAPLQEYPRPQLQRYLWTNLNGQYDCAITESFDEIPIEFDMKITVPFAVETPLSGIERQLYPNEILWYRRNFELDEEYEGKRVLLHFGAVDWECKVYINRQMVGGHTGGYAPFTFDITDYLRGGENELVVGVFDPTDKGWQQRGKQVIEPHGFWYTSTSGIWQTVWCEGVEDYYIRNVKITPDIDEFLIHTDIECNIENGNYTFKATVYDDEDAEVFSGEIKDLDAIKLDAYKLWTPESPVLYTVVIELFRDDKLYDTVSTYFGMRKFSTGWDAEGKPRLYLNNKPYFLTGLLDQGYWPDGGMTAPTEEAMIFDIKVMKSLGFNMLRKHIKVEPLRWYYLCDTLGMIVWQDMISGGEYIGNYLAGVLPNLGKTDIKDDDYDRFKRGQPEWREMFEDELAQMIDNLYNCVCIGCWVPFNEGWGQFDAKRIAEEVKTMDPSRIVDHASGWFDQGGGDVKSIHRYILPVKLPKEEDGRPVVLSEFGGYSRVVEDHVWNVDKSFGYKMYSDKKKLTKAYEKLYNNQIIPLISKGLSGVIYTQLSDVENEVNGILTYDREVMKIDGETIQKLNKKLISIIKE